MYKICFFITLLITNVSIAFTIIIGVALQEYEEYNNLPHCISGTSQCYNKYLSH
jgi:ABC-type phosphate transport system permease subunit